MFNLMDSIKSYNKAFGAKKPESELEALRDEIITQTGIDPEMKYVVDGILQDDTMTANDKFILLDEL